MMTRRSTLFAALAALGALAFGPAGAGTKVGGEEVSGFLCEAHAVQDAPEITGFGGWRAWRRHEDRAGKA